MQIKSLMLRTIALLSTLILLIVVYNAQAAPPGEMFDIASKLSKNGSELSKIGSLIYKSLSISKDGRERAFLTLATYELKIALLATGLSGQLIGTTQLVKQDEKKSLYQQTKGTLRNVVLTALIENRQFFSDSLVNNTDSKHLQLCRDANILIEDSISLVQEGIGRLE